MPLKTPPNANMYDSMRKRLHVNQTRIVGVTIVNAYSLIGNPIL